MFWQYHKLTLNMKSDAKIERKPSCQFDVIFGKTSPVYPENLENRNFALDFLEIVARKRPIPFLKPFQKKNIYPCHTWSWTLKILKNRYHRFFLDPIRGPAGFSKYRSQKCKTKLCSINRHHRPSACANFAEFTKSLRGGCNFHPLPMWVHISFVRNLLKVLELKVS